MLDPKNFAASVGAQLTQEMVEITAAITAIEANLKGYDDEVRFTLFSSLIYWNFCWLDISADERYGNGFCSSRNSWGYYPISWNILCSVSSVSSFLPNMSLELYQIKGAKKQRETKARLETIRTERAGLSHCIFSFRRMPIQLLAKVTELATKNARRKEVETTLGQIAQSRVELEAVGKRIGSIR